MGPAVPNMSKNGASSEPLQYFLHSLRPAQVAASTAQTPNLGDWTILCHVNVLWTQLSRRKHPCAATLWASLVTPWCHKIMTPVFFVFFLVGFGWRLFVYRVFPAWISSRISEQRGVSGSLMFPLKKSVTKQPIAWIGTWGAPWLHMAPWQIHDGSVEGFDGRPLGRPCSQQLQQFHRCPTLWTCVPRAD